MKTNEERQKGNKKVLVTLLALLLTCTAVAGVVFFTEKNQP